MYSIHTDTTTAVWAANGKLRHYSFSWIVPSKIERERERERERTQ